MARDEALRLLPNASPPAGLPALAAAALQARSPLTAPRLPVPLPRRSHPYSRRGAGTAPEVSIIPEVSRAFVDHVGLFSRGIRLGRKRRR